MPPLTAKTLPKIGGGEEGENQEKSGERGKKSGKRGKIGIREGSFTLPLLTDRAGYATG